MPSSTPSFPSSSPPHTPTPPALFSPMSTSSSAFAASPSLPPPSPSPALAGGLGDFGAIFSALQELHPGAARARPGASVSATPRILSPRPSRPRLRFSASNSTEQTTSTTAKYDSESESDSPHSRPSSAELSTVWSGPIAAYLSPSSPERSDSPSSFSSTSPPPPLPIPIPIPNLRPPPSISLPFREPSSPPSSSHTPQNLNNSRNDSPAQQDLGDFSGVFDFLHEQTSRLKRMVDIPYSHRDSGLLSPSTADLITLDNGRADSKRRALLDSLLGGAGGRGGVGVVTTLSGASIMDDEAGEDDEVDMEISDDDRPAFMASAHHTQTHLQALQPPSQLPPRPRALLSLSENKPATPRPPVKILLPSASSFPPPSTKPSSLKKIPNRLLAVPALAPPPRLLALAKKLKQHFPAEEDGLREMEMETGGWRRAWGAQREAGEVEEGEVHVFIDHSNILVGFLEWLKANPAPASHPSNATKTAPSSTSKSANPSTSTPNSKPKPHLLYPALALLLERGRRVTKRVLVASSPLYSSLEAMEGCGYEVSVLQRVPGRAGAGKGEGAKGHKREGSGSGGKNKLPVSVGKPAIGKATPSAKPKRTSADNDSTDTDTHSGRPLPMRPTHASRPSASSNHSHSHSHSQPIPSLPHAGPPRTPHTRFKEQAVDELLQLHIYKSLLAIPSPPPPGSTIVLATGDAASSEFNAEGFVGAARSAVKMGWRVEVVGWARGGVGREWWELEGKEVKVEGLEKWGWDLLE